MTERWWRTPLFFSGFVLLSQAFPLPAPVRDAATLQWVTGFSIHYPLWHVVFSPFCGLADTLTTLSLRQLYAVAIAVPVICIWAGKRRGPVLFIAFLIFVAWGALVPRPMGRLTATDPNILLIDFHSHSQYSHDGRLSFTPQANMRWHQLQGYNASFITDHNRTEAAQMAKAISSQTWQTNGYRSLEGEEVSLEKTHLVILGNHKKVPNGPYDGNFAKIPHFIKEMHRNGYQVIASLPEYWLYHWGIEVQDFVIWGMDGFEIINSAPKALDFPLSKRLEIVDLCRSQNLFITGISDNHGYGYATAVWNAIRIPNWQAMEPDTLEKVLLTTLKRDRFGAVQVLERVKFYPDSWWKLILTPLGTLWVYWRSLQPLQAISWLGWIWIAGIFLLPRKLLFNSQDRKRTT